MGTMMEVYNTIKNKPFLWLNLSFVVLPYCILEYMVLFPLLYVVYSIGVGNVYELTVSLIQFIVIGIKKINFDMHPYIVTVSVAILTMFIISIIMSFYFYMVNAFVNNRKIHFLVGIKNYVLRIFRVMMLFSLVAILFLIIGVIISLPALLLTGSVANNMSNGFVSVVSLLIIDLTTVAVLFFEMTIIITYFAVWTGCIYSFDRGSFYRAKRIFNEFFWELILNGMRLMSVLIVIEILFAGFSIWFSKMGFADWIGIFLLVFINSLTKSFAVAFYAVFVFIDLKHKKKLIV